MRAVFAAALALCLPAWSAMPTAADPASDAPEYRVAGSHEVKDAPSYAEALTLWRSAEDLNAWIGAKFHYDGARAMQLSETQRRASGPIAIHAPERFFVSPSGVCVDLARFAVETLKSIEQSARPAYLMIEFEPVAIGGNVLRRHWIAVFEREGQRYFFGDSKRPGHLAGPYASTEDFIAEYARYRGRRIVSFSERESYQRRVRAMAVRRVQRNGDAE